MSQRPLGDAVPRLRAPQWAWDLEGHAREDLEQDFGEQLEWGWAIPIVFRAIAGPPDIEPFPAPPAPGDPHAAALGYWCALLHVLIYSLGWARPDLGLRWWYDAGRPIDDDARLRLLAAYDRDGMLDLFAAWLWTTPLQGLMDLLAELTGYSHGDKSVTVSDSFLAEARRTAGDLGTSGPYGGGSDPLHLSVHCSGPLERSPGSSLMMRTDRDTRRAVLVVDAMQGWYRALAELGSDLPDLGDRSWHVDVVARPVGWLGTYRRSRETGLWFSGRHRHHTRGA